MTSTPTKSSPPARRATGTGNSAAVKALAPLHIGAAWLLSDGAYRHGNRSEKKMSVNVPVPPHTIACILPIRNDRPPGWTARGWNRARARADRIVQTVTLPDNSPPLRGVFCPAVVHGRGWARVKAQWRRRQMLPHWGAWNYPHGALPAWGPGITLPAL